MEVTDYCILEDEISFKEKINMSNKLNVTNIMTFDRFL